MVNVPKIAFIIGWLTVFAVACTEVQTAMPHDVAIVASEFLEDLIANSDEQQVFWGMTNIQVFHCRNCDSDVDDFDFWNTAESNMVGRKTSDSPQSYEATLSFWVKGNDLEGNPIKRKRELLLTVVNTGAGWEVKEYTFTQDDPLSFGQQVRSFGTWLIFVPFLSLWLSFMVFIIPYWVVGLIDGCAGTNCLTLIGVLFFLCALVASIYLSGYYGYDAFVSWFAVVLGVILNLLIIFPISFRIWLWMYSD